MTIHVLNSTEYARINNELRRLSPEIQTSLCDIIMRDIERREDLEDTFKNKTEDIRAPSRPPKDDTKSSDDNDISEELFGGAIALSLKQFITFVYRKLIRKCCCCCCCSKKKPTAEEAPVELDVQGA